MRTFFSFLLLFSLFGCLSERAVQFNEKLDKLETILDSQVFTRQHNIQIDEEIYNFAIRFAVESDKLYNKADKSMAAKLTASRMDPDNDKKNVFFLNVMRRLDPENFKTSPLVSLAPIREQARAWVYVVSEYIHGEGSVKRMVEYFGLLKNWLGCIPDDLAYEALYELFAEEANPSGLMFVYDKNGFVNVHKEARALALCMLLQYNPERIRMDELFKQYAAQLNPIWDGSGEVKHAYRGLVKPQYEGLLSEFDSHNACLAAYHGRESLNKWYKDLFGEKIKVTKKEVSSKIADAWAVVIGISQYEHSGKNGLENLLYADDDAQGFVKALKDHGWKENHIKLLTNSQATKTNIQGVLEGWLRKAGKDDLIVLYWSGHGVPHPDNPDEVYFACHDTDLIKPWTGLRMDRVRKALEERNVRNVIVLADTCHAGKLITRGDKGVSIQPYVEHLRSKNKTPEGWIFLVSADTDRKALELSSLKNGVFTSVLLEALRGAADGYEGAGKKDNIITMGEVRAYLRNVMPSKSKKVMGITRHPVITTNTGDPTIWDISFKGK